MVCSIAGGGNNGTIASEHGRGCGRAGLSVRGIRRGGTVELCEVSLHDVAGQPGWSRAHAVPGHQRPWDGRGARGGHAARLRQAHHEAGRTRRAGGRRAHGARRELSDVLRQRLHPDHVERVDQRAGRSGLPGESPPAVGARGLHHPGAARHAAAGRLPRQGRTADDDRSHQQPAGQRLHLGVHRRRRRR